ncbi:phosphate ABC transporter ATP-binding protein [Thermoactinomyces sp. CICC 10521]|jgi:phosphate transport system ATP-binding protein|uniref:Phosphate ABC transporter ATP-binding protein n=1 Tax=Thermoactinomyces daqus TaxID=1329516 RepID=A0A7W2AH80_9BACL|nr:MULTISPECIES: phosphate ABC transporter ATP-binding protein PstB [Thermoactinomyces]MBA4541573.1 phosphate ABC transporter ATP-binding protein [Thermoactinomyces daqus]MBH8597569.1 phosphate ABC transporter ATP-binding protein [Thermoactinomyces sp. CICC 10523]MBH8603910.1 phosphate ABC transporter ATP-binding protein [Thermoactinomyces sp. CICC 10522]MBH8606557.1 phosphate ABC transporter ATP-binding protein [Thermoactinomyces sp. CICC 10521]
MEKLITPFRFQPKTDGRSLLTDETRPIQLETLDLDVYYGEKHAIKQVNLPLYQNTVTALIGPSGCGKSTFLRCLNRMNDMIPGTRVMGKILVEGVNINDSRINVTQLRRQIGMVFQRPNPFAKSIYENIVFAPRLYGISKKEQEKLVEESLRKTGLWDEVKDRLHTSALALSGGQQQRLCIARAIAMKPKIILLDEPASALDPVSTGKIEELVQELKNEFTIAIVTHNMQQAARISDYTAYFYMGELIEHDRTDVLFVNPRKKETEDYLTGRFG